MEPEIEQISKSILTIINRIVNEKEYDSGVIPYKNAVAFVIDTINKNIVEARESLNEFKKENLNFNAIQQENYLLAYMILKEELIEWVSSSWGFAEQILPLLLGGVLVAGFLLGRPGSEALIPKIWIENLVGGNSLWSNLFASVVGAFMYFATLTEIPILQGLLGAGMGKGPALALLLAGPALSLPNMLVIRSILGTKKTLVFISLVIIIATFSGMLFGHFF